MLALSSAPLAAIPHKSRQQWQMRFFVCLVHRRASLRSLLAQALARADLFCPVVSRSFTISQPISWPGQNEGMSRAGARYRGVSADANTTIAASERGEL